MAADPVRIDDFVRPFRRDGLGYVWVLAERNLTLRADPIWERFHDVHAEIGISIGGKHLHRANFNLSNSRDRNSLVEKLQRQTNGAGVPWERIVEQFCVGVIEGQRQIGETNYTQEVPRRHPSYLIDNLVMRGTSNMLFAPGGSGKGMLSVALCCAVTSKIGLGDLTAAPASPFYFDWEDDFYTFEDRINAVARGLGVAVPRVPHRRMRGIAADRVNEMARAISEAGVDFGIIDSFSAAGGTTSDGSSWDTIAHRLFDALDQITDMTWLIIDHVVVDPKKNAKDPVGKAFGSIQKMNRVRNAWEMRTEQEPGSPTVHMRLYDAKWNHTGKRKPIGLRMEFDGDDVFFFSEDATSPYSGIASSLADKMAYELAGGALSTAMLALSLGTTENRVRNELSRNPDRFTREGPFIKLREENG